MSPKRLRRNARGFTLIEAVAAMSILLITSLALVSVQVTASKMNATSTRVSQAMALASDLAENMSSWSYDDSRLEPLDTVDSVSDPDVVEHWDMGTEEVATVAAQNSDAIADGNAVLSDALGSTYQGLPTDVDRDGTRDFTRYWTVWTLDETGSGTEEGKLVQIVVRWAQGNTGYKQVTTTVFRRNPDRGL